jgi:acetoacetyl-CoA reductase
MSDTFKTSDGALPLAGRVALVTGGSRGIGRAIALELALCGASIALNYRSTHDAAVQVKNEIEAAGGVCELFPGDIGNRNEVQHVIAQVIDWYGHIDVLVNNAGIMRDRSIRKMTDDEWQSVIDTNLGGPFYCVRAVAPAMMQRGWGRIVNIASFSGQTGNFGQSNYAASKGGLIAMTKVLALEFARYGVTANVIAPGIVDTDILSAVPPDQMQQLIERVPMKRLGRPEEIARAVSFLVCDGSYITGQQINVNGGIYL